MTEIKKFTETDFEFQEIARLYNLVSHDDKDHPDDVKDDWEIRDKSIIRNRLFLYRDNAVIGYLGYGQGRDENKQNCYFNISSSQISMEMDIDNNCMNKCYRKYRRLAATDCICLFMSIKIMISLKIS